MTETLINHVAVDVRVGLKTTTIGRIAQTISLLLNMNSLLSSLLANLLDLLDFISLLEVSIFNFLDSALILLLELI